MMADKKKYSPPNRLWFGIRLCILTVLILLFLCFCMYEAYNRDFFRSLPDSVEDTTYYDRYYFEGSYGSLRDLMLLYDIPDNSIYGKYWEIIRAKEHRTAYEDYKSAAAAGMDCESYAEEEMRQLEKMAASPRFPENAERIEEMIR
ncbi:MAG: hypothetical protein IKI75_06425 [Lachnospiraceae bacterium]|nr:hypothetical protein [Lachnospiraceae bacterium]